MEKLNIDRTEELSRRDVTHRAGAAWADWYWAKRQDKPQEERVAAILRHRFYRKWAQTGPFTIERNERGNRMYRDEDADRKLALPEGTSRYAYDFEPSWLGAWKQFDTRQDASYFGAWVDVAGMRTFTYAEGDRCLIECDTREAFAAELQDMCNFYGEAPPAWTTIDLDGTVTKYFDPRPTATLPAHAASGT